MTEEGSCNTIAKETDRTWGKVLALAVVLFASLFPLGSVLPFLFQDMTAREWLAIGNILAFFWLASFYIFTALMGTETSSKKLIVVALYFLVLGRSIYLGCMDLALFFISILTAALYALKSLEKSATEVRRYWKLSCWGVACFGFLVWMAIPWGGFESAAFSNEFSPYSFWRGIAILKTMWVTRSIASGDIWVGVVLATLLFVIGMNHKRLRGGKIWWLLALLLPMIVFLFNWLFAGHLNIRVQIQNKRNAIVKYAFFWRPGLMNVIYFAAQNPNGLELHESPILTAIRVGNEDISREILRKDGRTEWVGLQGPPIFCAADAAILYEKPEILDALLNRGETPSETRTALSMAATAQNPEVLALLLRHGYPLDDTSTADDERTPLIVKATMYGSLETMQVLLEHGADPNRDSSSGSPLLVSARHCDEGKMELLLKAGAVPDQGDGKSTTALHVAAARGCVPIIQLLLQSGANPNAIDYSGHKPVDYARVGRHSEAVRFLVNAAEHRETPKNSNGSKNEWSGAESERETTE